jgi:hypothetical protein
MTITDNFSRQDETRAEFSTLGLSAFLYAMQLHAQQKRTNLKLKTWSKQLFGYLLPASALYQYD